MVIIHAGNSNSGIFGYVARDEWLFSGRVCGYNTFLR